MRPAYKILGLLTLFSVFANGWKRGGAAGAAKGVARNRARAYAIKTLMHFMRRAGL